MPVTLEEDAADEILYLARVNEAKELEGFLSNLSAQTNHPTVDLIAAAIDPYSKNSALHYAAANGHIDILKLLLPSNPDKTMALSSAPVNAVNDAGNTPLHWAALNGRLDCVKLLVQSGADVTIINTAGHDAVFEAEINDKKEVVEWLLGAVEELEKGIGSNGEFRASFGMKNEDHIEVDDASQDPSKSAHEANSAAIEDIRKQVEDMNTNSGLSQGR